MKVLLLLLVTTCFQPIRETPLNSATNNRGGFYIEYPKGWKYSELGDTRTVVFGPESDLFRPMIEVDIWEKTMLLKRFIQRKNSKIQANNAFDIFEVDFYEKLDRKRYQYYYKTIGAGVSMYVSKQFIIHEKKVYIVTQTCASQEEGLYISILSEINESFEFI